MAEWKLHRGMFGGGNYVAEFDGFAVSYNPDTDAGLSIFAGDGSDETALMIGGKYFILNGDFRKDYERLALRGAEACLAFFHEKEAAHGSSWTTKQATA